MGSGSGAITLCGPYHMMVVRGGLGVAMERWVGVSRVAACEPLIVHEAACSLIFFMSMCYYAEKAGLS